ncbi:exodeoxyribonuclease VII large subunit [Erwinia amylovora]|uniref:Exodeoxyribonuclease 7 large subunit n=3 Tax=Erwinia amylovora TaxID=552 RepID=A0A831A3M0_ERWAM|nr:exodeoxyribonuclease VII large subunit [Erwinia amylovora]CDK15971.1 exodeoxyribonuclease VII large subunit [Erwinia amylovora LA635]CDK19338.1 exodeoxyribonuclease VII large subunit [Erwinia amylovora LA636]CDK22709.1 exodeoxyribonuclease VII large subunit [Erwinia amylovora LA637]ATZ12240.1 exodeoxyribonuclease VII large subunit [Erwinia amylovora]EKV53127.1 exodeoxyribonuclease VII large subunit [Erwinia amylovora ACW56400]
MSQAPGSNIFTVSRLNSTVRKLLELEMGQVWLSAEISNFSQPSSGHWYFTLKDDSAQVRCAMFRNGNRRVTFRPQNGQQVLVRATITLYEPRGDYQLIAESMLPAGDGLLQQQFEQLKQRLMAEGLFEQRHKQPLPDPARQVGVITSASGAALHDVLRVLQRRDPSLPVVIYPTPVQGAEAPPGIVRAIELANARNECDVLIVGRGGGSLEDLCSFNDERVARAIFASRIPIVSAVGHETDVTIADFAADLRAPTPSAAAELVSRNQTERLRQLQSQQQRMEMAMDYYLARQQRTFTRLQHRLQQQHPQLRLARQQTALMQLQRRLGDALQQHLRQATRRQQHLGQRLNAFRPELRIERASQQLQQWQYRLRQAMQQQLGANKQRFGQLAARLEGVSPLATLARGFSVTSTANGQLVKKTRQLHQGDTLKTRLDDGWVESEVTVITPLKKTRGRSVK